MYISQTLCLIHFFFFFQAEDGIRDLTVTGVQTCALPICSTASSGRLVRFQRASGPTPIRNSAGAISGTNTASKYGGPTEILPAPSASSTSGESVPSITETAATASSTLLASSADSREASSKLPPQPQRA